MLGTLNKMQMNNLLSSQVLGRLACADGNQPYVVPVTYYFDGKFIYGQTNEGKKLEILRKNPNVCFEVDKMMDMRNWQSVVITGKFEELKSASGKKARDLLFGHVFPLMTSSTIHPHEHEVTAKLEDSNRVKLIMYRVRIKSMSGRFEKQ
jgi:nitroimidazol reductase NimA-like FMN-containing flavoprotein (pyridoxamine 5'-phosphate oxidase superfamily)